MDPVWIVVNIIGLSAVIMVGLFYWEGPKKR
jgi:hypothetical protein